MVVKDIIKSIPILSNKKVEIKSIKGGLTNENYFITFDKNSCVLRIFNKDAELLGINRNSEIKNMQLAAKIGISPKVIYYDFKKGFLLSEYVSGGHFNNNDRVTKINKIARVLHKLHFSKINFKGKGDLFQIISDYKNKIIDLGGKFTQKEQKIFLIIKELKKTFKLLKLPKGILEKAPLHLDLMPGNIIFNNSGTFLIDWEYSGFGVPFFDLALVSLLNDFTSAEDNILLYSYIKEKPSANHYRWFYGYKVGACAREAFWAVIQGIVSKLDVNYNSYKNKQLKRFEKAMKDFKKYA